MIALTNLNEDWIPIDTLPAISMKVEWMCEDGTKDVGFYNKEQDEFMGWDLLSKSFITHWKPLAIILT